MNIWQQLTGPIFALAPMEDVTDTVFRRIVGRCAKPDLYFTEFTNVEGVWSKGVDMVRQRLLFTEEERPIIAQIWGKQPTKFFETAKLLVEMGFDGVDINMGCPVKDVLKSGAGAALCDTPTLAKEIILATKEGLGGAIPLSVKTRIGNKQKNTEAWIAHLLSFDLDGLTVHGRTAKEQSSVPADWDEIGKAVRIRDEMEKKTKILGNGDVLSREDGIQKCTQYGVDGVMIGRGIFTNPWIFDTVVQGHTQYEMFSLLRIHIQLFGETWGSTKNFSVLKKYFKIYCRGFDGASEIRERLMKTESISEVRDLVQTEMTQMQQ